MFEKSWLAVAPTLLTSDGSTNGYIQVVDTIGFKVKAKVTLSATGQPNLTVQCKRVISKTQMVVGPLNAPLNNTQVDLSAYTLAAGAFIFQDEQPRVTIAPADIVQAVYEQEPTVAIRVIDVDQFGNPYDQNNPMPIIFDGTVSIGEVEVVGSNGNILEPNADGSINVNIQPSTSNSNQVKNVFGSAAAVVSGATTTIVQYTVPLNKIAILERSVASGENIGAFTILINNVVQSIQRTYYAGGFNVTFEFITGQDNGLVLQPGDNVKVTILHNRPYVGNFDARIQVFEITP